MTVRMRLSTTIEATPDAVWADLEQIERHVEWMADAESITFRTRQRAGAGTEFDCRTRIGPFSTTDRMVVTEWEPGRSMAIEHRGAVVGRGRFTLEAVAGGCTRLCWDEHLRFPRRLGGPLGERMARPVLRGVWRRNLARLAARFDAPTSPSPERPER